jgi:cardiolipin synthase
MKTLLSFILTNHYQGLTSTIVAIIYAIISICAVIHILLHKHDTNSATGWIAVVILSPFVGVIFYIFLGINRVHRKATRLGKTINDAKIVSDQKQENVIKNKSEYEKNMIVYGQSVYNQEFLQGNSVEILQNGTNAYPKMLKAIRNAKKEVLVESYIFDLDKTGQEFLEAFKVAIKNGANIKVLVDGFGVLKFFKKSITKEFAKIKGLEFGVFLPPLLPPSFPFFNLRNHRKFIIVDGERAFFGGMNISHFNTLTSDKSKGILDIAFEIKGAIIDQISQIFQDDWFFVKGQTFQSCSNLIKYNQESKQNISSRIIPDGPDIRQNRIQHLICGAINFALKSIAIVTPYFLPENQITNSLKMAAMRGIKIDIIIPNESDHKIITWAQEANFKSLIEKGIHIYRQDPPFDHSKIFIVDDIWTFVGSPNWDVRSFRLNFEAALELFNKDLALKLLEIINLKKSASKLMSLKECQQIHLLKTIRNNAAKLLTPYL